MIRKVSLQCPFCPGRAWDHVYTTFHGFRRHVWTEHAISVDGKPYWEVAKPVTLENFKVAFLRRYVLKYSKFEDIPVNGRYHVEAIIENLVKGEEFNPSLRCLI